MALGTAIGITMDTPEPCDITYYAFGGGMGHVTRAAAILRHVPRLSHFRPVVVTNAVVPLPLVTEAIAFVHLQQTEPIALAAELRATLDALRPRLLVMDVFPHGVVGEMADVIPSLSCARALVCRRLRPQYSRDLVSQVAGFDLALCVEPPAPRLPIPVVDCAPVLLRDPAELPSRVEARGLLGVAPNERVLLAVSTEEAHYTSRLFTLIARLAADLRPSPRIFWASPNLEPFSRTEAYSRGERLQHYPLLEVLSGADVLVGASGYNLFSEAKAVGVPTVFVPRERRYDDQQRRAKDAMVASDPGRLAALLGALVAAEPRSPERLAFTNRASQAAAELVRLTQARAEADTRGGP